MEYVSYVSYVSKEDLHLIRDLIAHRSIEVCGNLISALEIEQNIPRLLQYKPKDGKLLLYTETVGEKSSCKPETYSTYIWHTHSHVSKGYPSAGDILLPLRKRPKTSLIFTVWGIWEISAGRKYNINKDTEAVEIQRILDQLYFFTDNGKANPLNAKQFSIVQKTGLHIAELMKKKGYDLKISFTDWRAVEGDYKLNFL